MPGRKAGANMICAIAAGGQMSFRVFDGRFTADAFIDFLARLIRTHEGRKIYLIADNHFTHHAKKIRQWLARSGRATKLELVFLPAYKPRAQPRRELKQDIKRHLRADSDRPADRDALMTTMRGFLRSAQRHPARRRLLSVRVLPLRSRANHHSPLTTR